MSGVPATARNVAEWLRYTAEPNKRDFRRWPPAEELKAAALYLEQLADQWETGS